MARRTLIAGLLAFILVVLSIAPASATHSLRDGSGRPLHWNRSGTALAQVYFVDFTGSRWPVNASTVTWNQSSRVKSYYASSCPSSTLNCVDVLEYNRDDGNLGFAEYAWDGNRHFTFGRVQLNNRYTPGADDDRQTVCQELGHILGLDHQSAPDSCMDDSTNNVRFPNSHDYSQLSTVYNH